MVHDSCLRDNRGPGICEAAFVPHRAREKGGLVPRTQRSA